MIEIDIINQKVVGSIFGTECVSFRLYIKEDYGSIYINVISRINYCVLKKNYNIESGNKNISLIKTLGLVSGGAKKKS